MIILQEILKTLYFKECLKISLLVSLSQDKVAIKTVEGDDYYYYDYHTYRPKRLTIAMPILF